MNLSEHFTLEEFTFSGTAIRLGINNTPSVEVIENLKLLCENILEPLDFLFVEQEANAIQITSGYRSIELNKVIGGSATSQHCLGQAVDFHVYGYTIEELYLKLKTLNLPFDQMIQEFNSWVHISYSPKNRRQFLRATKENGITKYTPDRQV